MKKLSNKIQESLNESKSIEDKLKELDKNSYYPHPLYIALKDGSKELDYAVKSGFTRKSENSTIIYIEYMKGNLTRKEIKDIFNKSKIDIISMKKSNFNASSGDSVYYVEI